MSKSIHQGVVDPKLRVHGVKNLRIADASVIPVIPDCRIQNSVYMIGERVRTISPERILGCHMFKLTKILQAADMIKAAHKDLYEAKNIPYFIQSRL